MHLWPKFSSKTSFSTLGNEKLEIMKTKILCLILISLFNSSVVLAQNPDSNQQYTRDSLKKELRNAKHDSDKIKIRFKLAELDEIYRISFWDSLIQETERHKIYSIESKSLNNLGFLYRLKENDSKAMNCFYKSLQIATENNDRSDMLEPIYNIVQYYFAKQKETDKGLEFCYKGLKLSEELNNKICIVGFNQLLGNWYFVIGDPKKALHFHLNALKINNELGTLNKSSLLFQISSDYEVLKDTNNAIHYAFESKKCSDMQKENDFTANIYIGLGVAYKMKHMLDSALYCYQYSNKLAKRFNNSAIETASLAHLSRIYLELGNLKSAEKYGLRAMQMVKENKYTYLITGLALTLKRVYEKEKNHKMALKYYELYISNRDSSSNEKNRKLAYEKEFSYKFEKKENENKLLTQQNQIQLLEIRQNKYFLAGSVGLLLLIIIITFLFFRQNKLRNEQQSAQLEQKLLLSQMNPHFIFNSLQAIQNFILKHNEKEAVKYLSSFASVTRNVLENSRMEVIPLKKEIALLENYLQLQKLRFKNRFDYNIEIDKQIDSEQTVIPPMLSQPFIENAVEHGFHGIERDGRITISFLLKNNTLIMEITDNGVGMKDSYSENKQHRSLALEITKERVAVMNKKNKEKVTFTISEAFPLQTGRKGVMVRFSLPYKQLI